MRGLIYLKLWSRVAAMRKALLKNIVVVLVGTKYPGNIGSVARAMHNTGLSRLRLASPECSIDDESYKMARGGSAVLKRAKILGSLKSALQDVSFSVGTTGKAGGNRRLVHNPSSLVPRIIGHARRQKVGIIFGPEDTGLVDEDLLLCQMLVRIPTDPQARSLNLAQAVMIMSYEIFIGQLERAPAHVAKLAPLVQVEAAYEHLQDALLKIGFLHPQNTRHMMFALRRLFGRAGLEESDVALLRGIARQITWYSRQGT